MAAGTDAGRVPRTIECELTDDMVDAGVPGDVVTVTGIVKVMNPELDKPGRCSDDGAIGRAADDCLYKSDRCLCVDCVMSACHRPWVQAAEGKGHVRDLS